MADSQISMPSYGGLMRFKEEYNSKLKFGPGVVVGAIVVTIFLAIFLKYFFPIA